jgi:hypothetical protein
MRRFYLQMIIMSVFFPAALSGQGKAETLYSLAEKFAAPSDEYRPQVWWHWMGSNFTKEGITKDLEAMKDVGIGGVAIFNLTSSVQSTHYPLGNNPMPEQTYRGTAYWEALRHTMSEARRLGLQTGLHGAPGYATTGSTWITEERSMQVVVSSKTPVAGGRHVEQALEKPELPVYKGYEQAYDSVAPPRKASYYRDIAVIAVREQPDASINETLDISQHMDAAGLLKWQAPEGRWLIYRIGHAPTMSHPHPEPDDIIGKTMEVDKMSIEHTVYYWKNLLEPLKEHIGEYFGNTFTYIWVDSYEAGIQNWTERFRDEFVRIKGYDPVPWIALHQYLSHDTADGKPPVIGPWFIKDFPFNSAVKRKDIAVFVRDYKDVIRHLCMECWQTGKEMLHQYGLQFWWEPYWGPFDINEGTVLADVPISEFWTHEHVMRNTNMTKAAARAGKRLLPTEALTGRPRYSNYTEDPAFMKHATNGAYATGTNLLFLNCWVHQPFDDRYQPGMSFGWWGAHFDRYQTWNKPGRAFFVYMARCQMMLQQGSYTASGNSVLQRTTPEAEIFFVNNPGERVRKPYAFPVKNSVPELWDPYTGTIRNTSRWKAVGDSIYLDLTLEKDEAVFVVFPFRKGNYAVLPEIETLDETAVGIAGAWNVFFQPKLDKPFKRKLPSLIDFSKQKDAALKYFAGTATYEKTFHIGAGDLGEDRRILLDLGELHDISELEINGKNAGVLWSPPYRTDITPYLKAGENRLCVHITNNWANRLIGDEQYPADFEWGNDRGEQGRALKSFPDWFVKNRPRPSGRKAFSIWYYFRKDSPLYPAGLLGPVQLIKQTVKANQQ